MKVKREKRLGKEFQRSIYEVLTTRIKNYDITEMFSITDVTVTSDLEQANVYVSVYSSSPEKAEKTMNAIISSAGEVRKILSKEMHIRTVPRLIFFRDGSAEYGEKIDKIINSFTYNNQGDDGNEQDDES